VRNLSEQPTLSVSPRAFGALSASDQLVLRHWIASARAAGFDDVQDLAPRRWPAAITGPILGVFMRGDPYAAWLAIERDGMWVVASCIDGSVARPVDSLAGALAVVYRAGRASECG